MTKLPVEADFVGWSAVRCVCRLLHGLKLDKQQVDAIIKELNQCLGGQP